MQAYIQASTGRVAIDIDDSTCLGRGATASVYPIRTKTYGESVAKIYHDPTTFNVAKIEAMLGSPPSPIATKIRSTEYPQYAWPTHVVFARGGNPIGYAMPRVDEKESLTLDHFYDRTLLAEQNAPEERSLTFKLEIGRNLAAVLAELHAHRDFMIDFKPQNIKVFRRSHIVVLLDCDSYSIQGIGRHTFPATNYTSQYIAPEALEYNMGPGVLYENQDRFALAVVLFQLLNNGTHPFQGIQKDSVELASTDDKVRERFYPHGLTSHPAIRPRPQSIHHCFDDTTRAMFDRAFAAKTSQRPSAREWSEHFHRLLSDRALRRCDVHQADPAHIHFAGKACGTCHFQRVVEELGRGTQDGISPAAMSPGRVPTRPPASRPGPSAALVGWMVLLALILAIGYLLSQALEPADTSSISLPAPSQVATDSAPGQIEEKPTPEGQVEQKPAPEGATEEAAQEGGGLAEPERYRAMALAWSDEGAWVVRVGDSLEGVKQSALDVCNQDYGSGKCKETRVVVAPTGPGCIVVARNNNDGSRLTAVVRSSAEEGRQAVMDRCTEVASGTCTIVYEGCNK